MYRIYKYVKYETVDGEMVTDDCLSAIVDTEMQVIQRIDEEMNNYIVKSRFIKEWLDCDFHVEIKNENDKWSFLRTVECIIDNEKRNITINHPVNYQLESNN